MTTTEAFLAIDRAALRLATPQFIDEALAEIYGRYYRARDAAQYAATRLAERLDRQAKGEVSMDANRPTNEVLEQRAEETRQIAGAILAETVPFNAEYRRRGGWTRAYLVQPGGHVHRSMGCQTCYPSTRFGWLTQMSDHTEAEIVELAGKGACSVCYPSAPRIGRNRLELPAEAAARAERDAAKAARDAAKAAKAIGPFTINENGYPETITTIAGAWSALVGNIADHRAYGYTLRAENNETLTAALADRLGVTVEQITTMTETKVAARIKREAR